MTENEVGEVKFEETLPLNQREILQNYTKRASESLSVIKVLLSKNDGPFLVALVDGFDEVDEIEADLGEKLSKAGITFTAIDAYWYHEGVFSGSLDGASVLYQKPLQNE